MHNSLHVAFDEILSFEKLVANLDKLTIANSGKQYQISLNSYFKSS